MSFCLLTQSYTKTTEKSTAKSVIYQRFQKPKVFIDFETNDYPLLPTSETKSTTTPTEQDMTNTEDMDIYDHNDQKTTFDCSHRGFNGGTYIYYYAVCSNSKGSCKTDLTYEIIPRY